LFNGVGHGSDSLAPAEQLPRVIIQLFDFYESSPWGAQGLLLGVRLQPVHPFRCPSRGVRLAPWEPWTAIPGCARRSACSSTARHSGTRSLMTCHSTANSAEPH